jgi:hypothetical protein
MFGNVMWRKVCQVCAPRSADASSRDPGDDSRQGDRQYDQERDRFAAEEAVPGDSERGQRAKDERDHGCGEADLHRGEQRVACPLILDRLREPFGGEALDRPLQGPTTIEGVDRDHDQGDVDEGEGDPNTDSKQVL